jgi:hypothetical protein
MIILYDNYTKASVWKFYKFVLTYCATKKISIELKEENIKNYLEDLVELGQIKKDEYSDGTSTGLLE